MPNPLRTDPSRTKPLRARFERDLGRRFRLLTKEIEELLVEKDVFGLARKEKTVRELVGNVEPREWSFLTDERKLEEFQNWLSEETGLMIVPEGQRFWENYVQQGYEKGAGRAFVETNKAGVISSSEAVRTFERGRESQFLVGFLGAPETVEKVKILAARVFTDLKGVSEVMATQLRKELVDGLVQGENPIPIARRIRDRIFGQVDRKIGKRKGGSFHRAKVIAHTEIIRAHAEGQLDAMERLGVQRVGVMVEWSTADGACPLCEDMNGVVLKIKEAHMLIPRHPSCVPGDMRICAPGLRAIMSGLYTGEIFDLSLTDGRRVSFTGDHIVLTQRGWVKAKAITDTDYLINSPRDISLRIPDKHLGEPRIADLYDAFVEFSDPFFASQSLLMSEDFHGDGKFFNSKVNVIGTDNVLRHENQLTLFGLLEEYLLTFGDVSSIDSLFLDRDSSLSEFLKRASGTTDSLMSSFGIFDILFARSLRHHQLVSSSLISEGDPSSSQYFSNGTTTQTEILRDTKLGDPRRIEFDNLIGGKLVKIKSVSTRHVSSFPVYDVTTNSSLYSVEGIVTSNCRCAFVPANVGEDRKNQVRSQSRIKASIRRSLSKEKRSTWPGKSRTISKNRPKSLV